jgi:hypothetical protein
MIEKLPAKGRAISPFRIFLLLSDTLWFFLMFLLSNDLYQKYEKQTDLILFWRQDSINLNMKKLILFLITAMLVFPVSAQINYWNYQTPYSLSLKRELITGGISASGYFIGKYIERNEYLPPFETGSFTIQDINRINFIDRGTAGRWDIEAEATGIVFKRTSKIIAAAGLGLFPGNLKERASLYVIYIEGYLLTQGVTSLVKGTTDRYRPFAYLTPDQINNLEGEAEERFLEAIKGSDIEDSFFSGDASITAYALIFTAKAFDDYFPDSKLKYGVWGVSVTGTALQAYFRTRSGRHFPTDVIAGSLVGGSLGFLVPYLHKELQSEKLSISPGINGLSLTYKF